MSLGFNPLLIAVLAGMMSATCSLTTGMAMGDLQHLALHTHILYSSFSREELQEYSGWSQ